MGRQLSNLWRHYRQSETFSALFNYCSPHPDPSPPKPKPKRIERGLMRKSSGSRSARSQPHHAGFHDVELWQLLGGAGEGEGSLNMQEHVLQRPSSRDLSISRAEQSMGTSSSGKQIVASSNMEDCRFERLAVACGGHHAFLYWLAWSGLYSSVWAPSWNLPSDGAAFPAPISVALVSSSKPPTAELPCPKKDSLSNCDRIACTQKDCL